MKSNLIYMTATFNQFIQFKIFEMHWLNIIFDELFNMHFSSRPGDRYCVFT